MKKYFIIIIIVLSVVFFSGYRFGVSRNNYYTIAATAALFDQMAASKSMGVIDELDKMRTMANGNKELECLIQREVLHLSEDYKECKSNDACLRHLRGDYSDFEALILNYEKNICKSNEGVEPEVK